MAWPFTRLRTYVNGAPPTIDGDDLNEIQDRIAALSSSPFLFGDGSDGDATLDGLATFTWASLVGSTYTLTRDIFPDDFTVLAGVTLCTGGFRIHAFGVFTNSLGAVVHNDGGNAVASIGGAAGRTGSMIGGQIGGVGGTTGSENGANGSQRNFTWGGAGGNGGPGASDSGGPPVVTTGGTGGAVTTPNATPRAGGTRSLFGLLHAVAVGLNAGLNAVEHNPLAGGGSGGGGGYYYDNGAMESANGGSGGGSAGIVAIYARHLVNEGVIRANGGNGSLPVATGGAPSLANAGAGGGGGGGYVILVYGSLTGSGTVTATGGTKSAQGAGGVNGTAGVVEQLQAVG